MASFLGAGVHLYQHLAQTLSDGLRQLQVPFFAKSNKMVSIRTIVVAGAQYLIHPHKLGTITATINPDSILPVTLMTTEEIFGGNLEQNLATFNAIDDVFVPDFGSVLIEKVYGNDTNSTTARRASLDQEVYALHAKAAAPPANLTELPSGPYILYGPNLYQAWKLYDDEQGAFVSGVIPEDVYETDAFLPLSVLSADGAYKSVGVPSRLYFPEPSPEKPLSGGRVSISDAMALNGVPISMSSRAWSSVYPYGSSKTAAYAQKLMDLGAVIVGKTKVSQFAAGAEWVDEKAPWNPRGEGYQDTSGSAAGAGAAMASYDWLAHAIGEDAVGGLRDPAAQNGVYALRPSFTNATLSNVRISSPQLDTIGLSARDLGNLSSTAKTVLGSANEPTIKKLLYFSDFEDGLSQEQIDSTNEFLKTIETHLAVTTKRIVLADSWSMNNPSDAKGAKLQEYIGEALFRIYCRDLYNSYSDFRLVYSRRFGNDPFLEETVKFKWEFGANVTEETYNSDLNRVKVFQTWFHDNVFPDENDTVVVLPSGRVEAHYRQDDPASPAKPAEITPDVFSSVLGAPHLVVPFSQLSYESKVSGESDLLPVSASVLGPVGSDLALIELVKGAFEKAKWPTSIKAGKTAFPA